MSEPILLRHKRVMCCNIRQSARGGLAPIEFVPFLPIYSIFLLALLFVARVSIAELKAGQEAMQKVDQAVANHDDRRTIAVEGRWDSIDASELQNLVQTFQQGLPLTSGSVSRKATVDPGAGVPMAISPREPVTDVAEVMSDSWEDRVFGFPSSQKEQPQLTLPTVVRSVAPGLNDLNAFTRLRQFSLGGY